MSNSNIGDLYNRLSYTDRYDELYKHTNTSKLSKRKDIYLSRTTRWVIFFMFFITGTVASIDHGTIPGAIHEIKRDLNIDKKELGLFGSLVFLGNLIGAMLSFTIINLISRKILLIASLGLCAICLYSFILTNVYWFLLFNRVIVGIFQVK